MVLELIRKKAVKTGAGIAGGSGVLFLIFGLHSDIKIDIAHAEERSKEHAKMLTETASELANVKLKNLENGQKTILRAIEKLDKRSYDHKH